MLSRPLKEFLKKNFIKGSVVCLTGAGVSAESGIPTFRGKGGLWEKYSPELFASREGLISVFQRAPERLVGFLDDFYSVLLKAGPNPAHIALADLEKDQIISAVITQNIDNLHQDAGSDAVIELHGNAFKLRCSACGARRGFTKERVQEMLLRMRQSADSHRALLRAMSCFFPRCNCSGGGRFRTDVVLFGEVLPEEELSRAYKLLARCSILLIVGTSLAVYPAAGLPVFARQNGAKLITVNNQPEDSSHICDYHIPLAAAQAMQEIREAVYH